MSSRTGIIPAYAGSTRARRRRCGAARDHPRIRGEHPHRLLLGEGGEGSSPHTRGARLPRRARRRCARIIPAYAGSTESGPLFISASDGSSPHTRGAPPTSYPSSRNRRIIPAYAGSTCLSKAFFDAYWDHPRIRGEHATRRIAGSEWDGSSPHTRGAPIRDLLLPGDRRIIPAYAGSTCRSRR